MRIRTGNTRFEVDHGHRVVEPLAPRGRWWLAATALVLPFLLSCINPNIVNKTGGNLYPLAPGDQPFVLVTIINDTTARIDLQITIDEGFVPPRFVFFTDLDSGSRTAGVLLPYPVLRLGLGPLDQPFTPSIVATLPNGLTVQVPFGQAALVAGKDFSKGDAIIFDLVADSRSASAISVNTGIVPGGTQLGPFSRAETFQTVTGLLVLNGLGGSLSGSTAGP